MLADAAESASRALVEPTPSRLEGLVQEIAMNRLLDGQFDECGLTLAGASCRRGKSGKIAHRGVPRPGAVSRPKDRIGGELRRATRFWACR